jgi:DNA gyrase subunit B
VDIEDAAAAELYFSKLMGERVEPRRDWITSQSRKVQNLDV